MNEPSSEIRFSSLLGLGVCAGLVTGLVEAGLVYSFQNYHRISQDLTCLGHSAELFWICPAVDICLFGLIGVLAGAASRFISPFFVVRILAWILVLLAFLDWLLVMFYGRIADYALFTFAAGISVATIPVIRRYRAWALEKCRILLPFALAIAILLVIVVQGGLWLDERIAENRLPPAEPGAPNVLVVVIDTLRADHLGCYRFDRPTSPVLDALAHRGALFENCFATAPWTEPSHASMLTGRLTHDHNSDGGPIDDRLPTLAEAMSDRGFRTAAFSANTGYFTRLQGFGRGFLRFEDKFFTAYESLTRTVFGRILDHFLWRRMIADLDVNERKDAALVNSSYLRWLDSDSGRPSFAILNYMEVHGPYMPNEPFRSQFNLHRDHAVTRSTDSDVQAQAKYDAEALNLYDACIAEADHGIGELLQSLDQRGLGKNTLVIVTGDHGEMFGEHGLRHHAHSLYPELLHVPLVICWPGHVPEDLRITRPVSLASLAATLLELVPGGADPRFPQPPLSRLWQEPASTVDWPFPVAELRSKPYYPAVTPAHYGSLKTLITPKWQLILNSGLPAELYDRIKDPRCLKNLAGSKEFEAEYRDLCAELERRSPGWL